MDDRNVAIVCLSETDWLVSYNSYTQKRVSRTLTTRSRDGGVTWSVPRPVCGLDARTRAAIVRLSTGNLLLPFYRAPGDQALVGLSGDDGDSWQVIAISNAPGFVGDYVHDGDSHTIRGYRVPLPTDWNQPK